MKLQKLSLPLSGMGLCLFPTEHGAGVCWEEATLQLHTMQLRSLRDYLHRARLPERTSCCPSAEQRYFASCFQNLRVSNCAGVRSLLPCQGKQQQPRPASLLSPGQQRALGEFGTIATSCFSPSQSSSSQLVGLRKTLASQVFIIPLPLYSLLL